MLFLNGQQAYPSLQAVVMGIRQVTFLLSTPSEANIVGSERAQRCVSFWFDGRCDGLRKILVESQRKRTVGSFHGGGGGICSSSREIIIGNTFILWCF